MSEQGVDGQQRDSDILSRFGHRQSMRSHRRFGTRGFRLDRDAKRCVSVMARFWLFVSIRSHFFFYGDIT